MLLAFYQAIVSNRIFNLAQGLPMGDRVARQRPITDKTTGRRMNSRKMGVVVLMMMFVVMGAALSGCSNNSSRQDIGTVSGAGSAA
jgi:hypothetical protein